MPKLHQILAVVDGTKNRAREKLTAIYHQFKKPDLFYGHVRSYKPLGSDPTSPEGEQLPDETKNVQADARTLLRQIVQHQSELLDVIWMRDKANVLAKADVQIGDRVVLKDAPVPFLLWLEDQLDNMHSEAKAIPVLDPAEEWKFSQEQNRYLAKSTELARSRKVPRPLVLAAPTREHPAQVKEVMEDVRCGTYTVLKYSTALPASERDAIVARVEQLQRAVKFAREHANEAPVTAENKIGTAIYDFIFTGT